MNFVFEREIDRTGRIVIPIDIRKHLCISEESALIITVEDDKIIIKKKEKQSIFF